MSETASTFERLKEAYSPQWRELKPGHVLDAYMLIRRIGCGRYSEVWQAEDKNLGQHVAIKIFTPHRFLPEDQREAAERFYKGATAMARLKHDNVAQLCSSPDITDGYLWFAMNYYEEGDLGKAIHNSTLSEVDLTQIFKGVLEGICHAHQAGVIHRDIRPSNILLTKAPNGTFIGILADFDMAYWDNLLFSDISTTAIPTIVRYVPDDLLRAGKNHPDQKAMMRRKSNDAFSAVVVLLDIFASPEASAASGDEGHFQDLLTKAGRTFRGGKPLSAELRNRISRVLAIGLKGREADRFKSIESLQVAWEAGGHEPRAQFLLGFIAFFSITVTLAALAEHESFKLKGTQEGRILSTAVTSLCGVSGVSLILWFWGKWRQRFTTFRLFLGAQLYSTTRRRTTVILLSLMVPALTIWRCGPQNRLWAYRVSDAARCRLVDSTGRELTRVSKNDSTTIMGEDAQRLLCPKEAKHGASVYELSIITPSIRIDEDFPDAGVDANQVNAINIPLIIQRITPENPPTEEAIEDQLLLKLGDSSIRTKLDSLRNIWPRYLSAEKRISYTLSASQFHDLVNLQNEALDIANGAYRLSDHAKSKGRLFIAYKWHALAGHLASLALKCNKGLTYIADAIRHDGIDNTLIWIGDAVRCINNEDQYQAVRTAVQNLPLRDEGKRRLESVLVWLAMTRDHTLIRARVRLRAILLLEVMNTLWGDQRSEAIEDILSTSQDCDELHEAIELAKKHPSSAREVEKIRGVVAGRIKSAPNICGDILGSY